MRVAARVYRDAEFAHNEGEIRDREEAHLMAHGHVFKAIERVLADEENL